MERRDELLYIYEGPQYIRISRNSDKGKSSRNQRDQGAKYKFTRDLPEQCTNI